MDEQVLYMYPDVTPQKGDIMSQLAFLKVLRKQQYTSHGAKQTVDSYLS
jgi:hypothetical protein